MDRFFLDIKEIYIAHEYEITEENKCDYTLGRGSYGLVFCISGSATYRFTNGEVLNVKAGDLLMIGKNSAYKIVLPKPFKHYTVNFDIHDGSSSLPITQDGYFKTSPQNFDEYKRAFKELTKNRELIGDELRDMNTVGRLYSILGMLFKDEEEKTQETYQYRRLMPAKSYIEQNFGDNITLDTLAKIANMSITNFRREWLRAYGETSVQYRDRRRLESAVSYLMSGCYNVNEVAALLGFEDVSYFVRFFKKKTGLTPGEVKKQNFGT